MIFSPKIMLACKLPPWFWLLLTCWSWSDRYPLLPSFSIKFSIQIWQGSWELWLDMEEILRSPTRFVEIWISLTRSGRDLEFFDKIQQRSPLHVVLLALIDIQQSPIKTQVVWITVPSESIMGSILSQSKWLGWIRIEHKPWNQT